MATKAKNHTRSKKLKPSKKLQPTRTLTELSVAVKGTYDIKQSKNM